MASQDLFSNSESTEIAQAGPGSEPIGQVDTLVGRVTVTRLDGSQAELNVGDPIFQGDALETGSDGSIGVVLADKTTFSMAENGRMSMDEMVYDPSAQSGSMSLSVTQGVFTVVSGLIAKTDPDAMALTTPVATIGIRGTQLAFSYDAPGGLKTVLMEEANGFVGEVTIKNSGGVQVLNLANQGSSVLSETSAPSQPTILSKADVVNGFGNALRSLPASESGNRYDVAPIKDEQKTQEATQQEAAATEETGKEGTDGETAKDAEEASADATTEVAAAEGSDDDAEALADVTTAAGGDVPADVPPPPPPADLPPPPADIFGAAGGDDLGGTVPPPPPPADLPPPPAPVEAQDNTVAPPPPPPAPEIDAAALVPSLLADVGISSEDDHVILIEVTASLADRDGSESLSITLSNIPADSTVMLHSTDGSAWVATNTGLGTWTIAGDGLDFTGTIAVTTPDNYDGSVPVVVSAMATEVTSGTTASAVPYVETVEIDAVPPSTSDGEGVISIENLTFGTSSKDTLVGSSGDDILLGAANNDVISAGDGNDIILGGTGNDSINAGAGNDLVAGGMGQDTAVFGGARSEYEIVGNKDGSLTVTDLVAGRGGVDILQGIERLQFSDAVYDTATLATDGPNLTAPSNSAGAIYGGNGSDTIVGHDSETTSSSSTPPTITTPGGSYHVNPTPESSYEVHQTSSSTFSLSTRNLQTYGANEIYGGGGSDVLAGHAGDSRIEGGDDNDFVLGGVQLNVNESYRSETNGYTVSFYETNGMPDGYEYGYDYEYRRTDVSHDTHQNAHQELYGNAGDDRLVGGVGDVDAEGGEDNDVLIGSGGANVSREFRSTVIHDAYTNSVGSAPSTTIDTSDSTDTIRAFAESTLDGGTGNDLLIGGFGDNRIYGGFGDDAVIGGTSANTYSYLSKNTHADGTISEYRSSNFYAEQELYGDNGKGSALSDGNDILIGGRGDNDIYGGGGNDIISGASAFNESSSSSSYSYTYGYSNAYYNRDMSASSYVEGGDGNDVILGGVGNNELYGGAGNDVITGSTEFNQREWGYEFGYAGEEKITGGHIDFGAGGFLYGGEGNDLLIAGVGYNYLDGGSGNDTLVSGSDDGEIDEGYHYYGEGEGFSGDGNASDVLTGGAGDDTFVFHAGDGSDTVTDFGIGDKLVFDGFTADQIDAALDSFFGAPGGVQTPNVVIGAGAGDDRVQVTLENQFAASRDSYTVTEDANGNAVVTANTSDIA